MLKRRLSWRHALAVIATVITAGLAPTAVADALQDADRLLVQGQAPQALAKVDSYLAAHPKDASGRFLRGVILTEMKRTNEAIAIFTKLTEDYPSLPEPYNNLAVIYAQQKQYDKAKAALESAIRTHPSYATAHENLGDIYARLASQAYDKALQLDSSNKAAQTKLAMIRDLMTTSAPPSAPITVATAKPVVTPPGRPIVSPPAVVAAASPSAPAAAVAAPPAKPEPKPDVKPPAKPEPASKPIAKPAADNPAEDEVTRALTGWAEAWSSKDAGAYLGFYARDFKTPGGVTRAAWAQERTRRVTKPGKISVTIERARVIPEGDNMVVKFRQHYKSATLSSSSNKTLLMTKQNGKWKILQERIGG